MFSCKMVVLKETEHSVKGYPSYTFLESSADSMPKVGESCLNL